MFYDMNDYILRGFEKSKRKNKKYNALLFKKENGKIYAVPFGDNRMEHYHDKTGLNMYPMQTHKDPERRRLYHLRHSKDVKEGMYSPGYFSMKYLW
jgi:hypothetical protein